MELLREIKRVQPEVAVVLMTAFGELETAVEAMSAGAYWFMKKPFEQEELLALAGRAFESQKMWLELKRLRNMSSSQAEYTVARTYLEWLCDLPWNTETEDKLIAAWPLKAVEKMSRKVVGRLSACAKRSQAQPTT